MKYFITYLFFLVFFYSCNNEHEISFERQSISSENCKNCPHVAIEVPKAIGSEKVISIINSSIEEELISLLDYDDTFEVTSLTEAIISFKNGYLSIQEKFADENANWEVDVIGTVIYQDEKFITIALDASIFTGGAHGYHTKRLLNFDKQKGEELSNETLFKDLDAFRDYTEQLFRKKEGIPEDKPINHTGFMFEEDIFHLPENMGFTEKGFFLIYNKYEIASYADGSIVMLIPYEDVKKHLHITPIN